MSIAELLLETADSDRDLLRSNLNLGDKPELPRDIDFVLYATDEARARLVCDFITDNSYGRPSYEAITRDDGSRPWRLLVTINAPATPEVACALSGFMACLSKIYELDYDGWGCVIRREA